MDALLIAIVTVTASEYCVVEKHTVFFTKITSIVAVCVTLDSSVMYLYSYLYSKLVYLKHLSSKHRSIHRTIAAMREDRLKLTALYAVRRAP